MKRLFAFSVLAYLVSGSAQASDAAAGNITQIITIPESGAVLFDQSGVRTARPSCASAFPARWAIPARTPFGQAQLSILLTAYAQQKQVILVGYGNCLRQSDTETVRYLKIVD
tara:strand:- start:1071 stop:1409 length:339 start_codon:yes stop_codon:yes gene_type:complete